MQKIIHFFARPYMVTAAYVLLAVIASVQSVLLPTHLYHGAVYTEYNNYVIFRQSWFHLLSGSNLYMQYPAEYWDLYKYSPTFALAMGAFAHLPDAAGLALWNLINALALLWAMRLLPFKTKTHSMILWFVLLELLTSMQNAQSNGLMAGLLIAAYAHLNKGKPQLAALWIVIATFIKVYGAVGFCLFLLFPDKIKFISYSILWCIVAAMLPLTATGLHTLIGQYHNWVTMMAQDESTSYGMSVMGWLHSWFGVSSGKRLVSIIGIVFFLIPLARIQLYRNSTYQLYLLAFMLIWVIIFNHKAESPTYVIAVAGVAIWYFTGARETWRSLLLATVFVFTCLSPTDLFPLYIRSHFLVPYTIKAVPCIIVWVVIFSGLMRMKNGTGIAPNP